MNIILYVKLIYGTLQKLNENQHMLHPTLRLCNYPVMQLLYYALLFIQQISCFDICTVESCYVRLSRETGNWSGLTNV